MSLSLCCCSYVGRSVSRLFPRWPRRYGWCDIKTQHWSTCSYRSYPIGMGRASSHGNLAKDYKYKDCIYITFAWASTSSMNMRNAVSPLLHSALAVRRHRPPSRIIGCRFSLAALQKFVTAKRKYPSLTGLLASVDVKQQSLSPWSHASLQLPQREICRVTNVHFQCNAQQLHSLVAAVTGGSDWL